ncbi:ABC transporter permease [Hyphomicrobiales bacterium]|nr:ABC transporter permease [Hyphomicrobiales bacterium]CAH1675497.1 Di/tripeptide transport system permease protein DppB [Hyphomicrobiales bacterium]
MTKYIARRLLQLLPVMLFVVVTNFILIQLAPGDAIDVIAGQRNVGDIQYLEALRREYGLDQPVYVQLWLYVVNVLKLDLGYSIPFSRPVLDLILERLFPTILLVMTALTLSVIVGLFFGTVAARFLNSIIDNLVTVAALIGYATPIFWIGLMLIVLFSVNLGLLPSSGMFTPGARLTGFDHVIDVLRHLVLPAVTLSTFYTAIYTRLVRASVLEVDRKDFVRTARAKGLPQRRVVFRHVVPNAILPLVTMVGVQMGSILGGAVLVESVFSWPGMGRLAFEAITQRDLNLLLGILLFSSVLVVVMNLVVDLLYAVLDPRIESVGR